MAARIAGSKRGFALGQTHDINVTPFVDVLLVLLIVTMVAAPLATSAIKIDIPRAAPGQTSGPPTVVSITEDGRLWVSAPAAHGGWPMRPATFDSLASVIAATPSDKREIMIRADAHVPYGRFVAVLNRLQQAGYYKVGIVSEEVRGA